MQEETGYAVRPDEAGTGGTEGGAGGRDTIQILRRLLMNRAAGRIDSPPPEIFLKAVCGISVVK